MSDPLSASLLNERLFTLAEAASFDWLPRRRRGKKPNTATLWRWIRHGCFGVRLRATSVGATLCVKESDLREFFAEITRRREVAP